MHIIILVRGIDQVVNQRQSISFDMVIGKDLIAIETVETIVGRNPDKSIMVLINIRNSFRRKRLIDHEHKLLRGGCDDS